MNVVFDLGKVLIEWDPRHLYRKVFADAAKMEWFLAEVCHGAWNEEQDRGRSFDAGVVEATARHPAYAAEIALYRDRWSEMVPGALDDSVAILRELQGRGAALYAITNWNGETFRATRARFDFLDLFRDIVVSGDVGLVKPDQAIFHLFASRNGLALGDCLFIDDSPRNVAAARAAGMRVHHFTGAVPLRQALQAEGLL